MIDKEQPRSSRYFAEQMAFDMGHLIMNFSFDAADTCGSFCFCTDRCSMVKCEMIVNGNAFLCI